MKLLCLSFNKLTPEPWLLLSINICYIMPIALNSSVCTNYNADRYVDLMLVIDIGH